MSAPAPHPLESDCLALWRFDESNATDNAADATGNGHTATQSSSPAVTTGKFDNARVFVAGDYLTVADNVALHPNEFTFACWANYDGTYGGTGTWQRAIFYDWTLTSAADAAAQLMVRNNSTKVVQASIHTAAGYVVAQTTNALSTGTHHFAMTWNMSSLLLYIDGFVAASASGAGVCTFGPGPFRIGNDPNFPGAPEYWRGWIDDLAFYSSAKTSEWVKRRVFGDWDCSIPKIGGDFSLDHYLCLANSHKANNGTPINTVPFSYGNPIGGILRNRISAPSGSIA